MYIADELMFWVLLLQQVVEITFTDFDTEYLYDYLVLYDGYNATSDRIAKLTSILPSFSTTTYHSSQQYMYLNFKSDSDVGWKGFQAYFTSTTAPTSPTYPTGNVI